MFFVCELCVVVVTTTLRFLVKACCYFWFYICNAVILFEVLIVYIGYVLDSMSFVMLWVRMAHLPYTFSILWIWV